MTTGVGKKATNPLQGLAAAFPCPEHRDKSLVYMEMGSLCTPSFASPCKLCSGALGQHPRSSGTARSLRREDKILLDEHTAAAAAPAALRGSGTRQGWGGAVLWNKALVQGHHSSPWCREIPGRLSLAARLAPAPAPSSGGSFRQAALIKGGCWGLGPF